MKSRVTIGLSGGPPTGKVTASKSRFSVDCKRVAVGLSGGVDSAVAAGLLIEQGYEVTGVYVTCWDSASLEEVVEEGGEIPSSCQDEQDKKDALDVALKLKIPFVHLDFRKEYKERVFASMMEEYRVGRTPNPDVMCNREIKFGLFYEWALRRAQGKPPRFDFVATGHYAQIKKAMIYDLRDKNQDGLGLYRSVDEHKDQTYFLHQLRQEQLEHILFPIGHLTKQAVRSEAKRLKLPNWDKPDSQGICFVGKVGMTNLLASQILKQPGKIYFKQQLVGEHRGIWFYTIGQKVSLEDRSWKIEERMRKQYQHNLEKSGFNLTKLPHLYVIGKEVKQNILHVGTKEMGYVDKLEVGAMHWIGKPLLTESLKAQDLFVRIRHGGELVKISKLKTQNLKLKVNLMKGVWGVAAGQSAVFYAGETCLGGGVIE